MRDRVLEMLVDAAQDVENKVAIFDGRSEISKRVGHLLHVRCVVDDRELVLREGVEVVEEVGRPGVAIVAEEGTGRPPEGVGSVAALLHHLHSGRRDHGLVPLDNGEIVEYPVGGDLRGQVVNVVQEPELGQRGEELAVPEAVIFLLEVEDDEHMIADAKPLELSGGEALCCNGLTEIFIRAGVRGVIGRAHGGEGRENWVGERGSGSSAGYHV